jgi:hypothetical protein
LHEPIIELWAVFRSHVVHVVDWMRVLQACNFHEKGTGYIIKRREITCSGYLVALQDLIWLETSHIA